MAISYTPEEVEQNRLEDLEEKLRSKSSLAWNDKNKDFNGSEEEEDESIQKYLEDNRAELEGEFLRETQPGTFYCHEAIEAAAHILNDVHERLQSHPSIVTNPEWYAMTHEAGTILFNLYQAIGAVHLDAIPDNIIELIEANKKDK